VIRKPEHYTFRLSHSISNLAQSTVKEREVTKEAEMKDVESGKPTEMVASSKGEAPPSFYGIPLKHMVLVLLTVQNAGAVLLMRYTRSIPGETEFITQTAVIMQEVIKGLTCVFILMYTEGTIGSAWAQPVEALKTSVPALLYLGQNNLQYVAVGLLDAATYTVTYQTKTIWSGIFTVFLLGRTLKSNKWLGLAMLSVGVGVVQLSAVAKAKQADASNGTDLEVSQRATGFFIILFAAALSSLAGV
jgi:solute carrier family 35 (UDP-sugar transporter), member A1/2/3